MCLKWEYSYNGTKVGILENDVGRFEVEKTKYPVDNFYKLHIVKTERECRNIIKDNNTMEPGCLTALVNIMTAEGISDLEVTGFDGDGVLYCMMHKIRLVYGIDVNLARIIGAFGKLRDNYVISIDKNTVACSFFWLLSHHKTPMLEHREM